MSAGLVAVLVIAAVLVCVAVGLVWWVNRPVPLDRPYARQTLPLFGSDVIIDEMWIEDEEPDGDDAPPRRDQNVATSAKADSAAAVAAALNTPAIDGERRAHRFAPPPGASPVSSMQAPRAFEPPVEPQARETVDDTSPAASNSSNGHSASHAPVDAGTRSRTPAGGWNTRAASAAPRHSSPRQSQTATQTPAVAAEAFAEAPVSAGATFEGKSLTFSVPSDGTLQFLPGRLEITAGKDVGREVRFVRVPGINTPRVTFGRVDGPMYRHVQLHDQTVSRKHAIMELVEGEWTLTNLSTTNPVVHNERLLGEGETQALSDGDRIEMGEVVFRYRVR
jgi:hypothetical protein